MECWSNALSVSNIPKFQHFNTPTKSDADRQKRVDSHNQR